MMDHLLSDAATLHLDAHPARLGWAGVAGWERAKGNDYGGYYRRRCTDFLGNLLDESCQEPSVSPPNLEPSVPPSSPLPTAIPELTSPERESTAAPGPEPHSRTVKGVPFYVKGYQQGPIDAPQTVVGGVGPESAQTAPPVWPPSVDREWLVAGTTPKARNRAMPKLVQPPTTLHHFRPTSEYKGTPFPVKPSRTVLSKESLAPNPTEESTEQARAALYNATAGPSGGGNPVPVTRESTPSHGGDTDVTTTPESIERYRANLRSLGAGGPCNLSLQPIRIAVPLRNACSCSVQSGGICVYCGRDNDWTPPRPFCSCVPSGGGFTPPTEPSCADCGLEYGPSRRGLPSRDSSTASTDTPSPTASTESAPASARQSGDANYDWSFCDHIDSLVSAMPPRISSNEQTRRRTGVPSHLSPLYAWGDAEWAAHDADEQEMRRILMGGSTPDSWTSEDDSEAGPEAAATPDNASAGSLTASGVISAGMRVVGTSV